MPEDLPWATSSRSRRWSTRTCCGSISSGQPRHVARGVLHRARRVGARAAGGWCRSRPARAVSRP